VKTIHKQKRYILILAIGIVLGVVLSNYRIIVIYGKVAIKNIVTSKQWLNDFVLVEIPSSYDGQAQKAYFYSTTQNNKMPLIVSLHPWSADYSYIENTSSLAQLVKSEDWNYVYPDFRGKNNTPQSCLSDAVIQDIDDAIAYAIMNANVDTSKIVVIGSSGGAFAALGVYLKSVHAIKYCMAWCPISDLEAWYYQSKYMGTNYWKDIAAVTDSDSVFNSDEAKNRSPLYMLPSPPPPPPTQINDKSCLEIYTGINDGYTGSVPILHSILFYNKMTEYLGHHDGIISDSSIITLLSRTIKYDMDEYISDRKILYKKSYADIGLFIFDGTHEILPEYAFDRIKEICFSNSHQESN
jgi:pimeloyl-ACP methyl ester carboxylesterase